MSSGNWTNGCAIACEPSSSRSATACTSDLPHTGQVGTGGPNSNARQARHAHPGVSAGNDSERSNAETRAWASSYAYLATVGPELTGLSRGTYLVQYRCQASVTESLAQAYMSVSINGATAIDADSVTFLTSGLTFTNNLTRALVLDLTDNENTLTCKYKRIGDGTTVATFFSSWLIALRVANL